MEEVAPVVAEPAAPVVVLQETTPAEQPSNSQPVFKVQFLISPKHLVPGSTQFKGVKADSYKEDNVYKYTYGSTTNYNEIVKMKNEISDRFPDAFIVAFKDGQKVNASEAINEWKKKVKRNKR